MDLVNTNPNLLIPLSRRPASMSLRVVLSEHLKDLKDIHSSIHLTLLKETPAIPSMASSRLLEHLFSPSNIGYQLLIDLLLAISVSNLLIIVPILTNATNIHTVSFLEYLIITLLSLKWVLPTKTAHASDEIVARLFEWRLFRG